MSDKDKLMAEDGSWGDDEKNTESVTDTANSTNEKEADEAESGPAKKAPSAKKGKAEKKAKKVKQKKSMPLGLNKYQLAGVGAVVLTLLLAVVYFVTLKPSAKKPPTAEEQLLNEGKRKQPSDRKADKSTMNDQDVSNTQNESNLIGPSQAERIEKLFAEQSDDIESLQKRLEEIQSEATGKNSGKVPEQLNRTIEQIIKNQKTLENRISRLSNGSGKEINDVKSETAELKAQMADIENTLKAIENKEKEQQAAKTQRISGNDVEIISVTNGFAFLRKVKGGEQFSLQVGESLRGYGQVSEITALGCIVVGQEMIEPIGGVCEF